MVKTYKINWLCLFSLGFFLSAPWLAAADETWSLADRLPMALSDPLGAEKSIAPYVGNDRLKPASCPSIPSEGRLFALPEIVALALCHNPETRSAFLSLMSQGDSTVQAYSAYFPTLSASASMTRTHPSKNPISRSSGLDASWTLFDFGQRELSIEAAELSLIAAGHGYSSTLQGAIAAAVGEYYSLLTTQNNIAVVEESERLAKTSYEAAKLRHEIGQVAIGDVLQAKSSYSQAILSTQSARNALATGKARMARLIGLGPDQEIAVAELDDSMLTADPLGGKLPELLAQAKERRVDLLASRASLENAKIALKKTERSNLGSVTVTTSGSIDQEEFLSRKTNTGGSIGLSVSIPIFTGFDDTYTLRSARRSVETQEIALAAKELDVEKDVWDAWHGYQTAQLRWDTSFDLLQSATQFKDVALGRYKEGIGTILDLLSAQSQYNSALQSHLSTRYDLLLARVNLVRAVGTLDLHTMQPETPPAAAETENDAAEAETP